MNNNNNHGIYYILIIFFTYDLIYLLIGYAIYYCLSF